MKFFNTALTILIVVFAIYLIFTQTTNVSDAQKMEEKVSTSIEATLDRISDRGSISSQDITRLEKAISIYGGSYRFTMSVDRLVPVKENDLGFTNEYKTVYIWDSQSTKNSFPKDVIYLYKKDFITLSVEQIAPTAWQLSDSNLRKNTLQLITWSRGKEISSDGNAIHQAEGGY